MIRQIYQITIRIINDRQIDREIGDNNHRVYGYYRVGIKKEIQKNFPDGQDDLSGRCQPISLQSSSSGTNKKVTMEVEVENIQRLNTISFFLFQIPDQLMRLQNAPLATE